MISKLHSMLKGKMVVRNDSRGSGVYLAPRGSHLHKGVDYVVKPGEPIQMPFDGYMVREARPYSDSDLSGCVLQGDDYALKVFYMQPSLHFLHTFLYAGAVIGTAQDVRVKWGQDMTPHIHVEIITANIDKLWLVTSSNE